MRVAVKGQGKPHKGWSRLSAPKPKNGEEIYEQ